MINIFNRLIFDVKYFNSWKKDDFFWFPVSALRFQVSSLATRHQPPVTRYPPLLLASADHQNSLNINN
jgi:hypothetical protein